MGQSAAAVEKAIVEAVAKCGSLKAIGLWFKMQNVIKVNRTTAEEPTREQFTLSLDRIAPMVGKSNATHQERRVAVRPLLSALRRVRVDDEPLLQRLGRDYFSPPLFRVARERWRVAHFVKALRYTKKRNITPTPKGAISQQFPAREALHYTGSGLGSLPPPPPPSLSPTTPLLSTPSLPPPSLFPAASLAGDAAPSPKRPQEHAQKTPQKPAKPAKQPGARPPERKVTDEQLAAKKAFDAWWENEGFPKYHHGVVYEEYDSADAKAVWKMLAAKSIGWDLERAKAFATFYLQQPAIYSYSGHRLRELGNKLGMLLTKFNESKRGYHDGFNGHKQRAAAAGGEYRGSMPVGSQRLGGDDEADAG